MVAPRQTVSEKAGLRLSKPNTALVRIDAKRNGRIKMLPVRCKGTNMDEVEIFIYIDVLIYPQIIRSCHRALGCTSAVRRLYSEEGKLITKFGSALVLRSCTHPQAESLSNGQVVWVSCGEAWVNPEAKIKKVLVCPISS